MTRVLGALSAACLAVGASFTTVAAQTCVGTCGALGADGVVTAPPIGGGYQYVSSAGGVNGVALPGIGGTNGSVYTSSLFSADANDALEFYFNYVTSDGSGFADYAWARLLNENLSQASLLFTARTLPSGTIVPGLNMPTPDATLAPPSVPIIPNQTTWSPLGTWSGSCFSTGCGMTGWVFSQFVVESAGNYFLEFGVTNWIDTLYDSGLAWAGAEIGGAPIDSDPTDVIDPGEGVPVPEPGSFALLLTGFVALGAGAHRRNKENPAS